MATQEAVRMLEAFGSVGALRFDVTLTDAEGNKIKFRRNVALGSLRHEASALLARSERQQENIIIRPYPPPVFLQLDDLNAARLERVQQLAFLTIETSPSNFQAWLALTKLGTADFARRVRKATGADLAASGATRLAGSRNFKSKYVPDFPSVSIVEIRPGLIVTPEKIVALGLAPEEPVTPAPTRAYAPRSKIQQWPDYQKCLANAPANHAGNGPDVSRADFTFALIAQDWGWSGEATAARLMEQSAKAKENGEAYARRTCERAAEALSRRNRPAPPQRPKI